MMVKPTVKELLEKVDNRFELLVATAKRAREIANGAEVLTQVDEEAPVTLAANEIAEGKVVVEEANENDTMQEKNEADEQKENKE